jgi:hypothetical protein
MLDAYAVDVAAWDGRNEMIKRDQYAAEVCCSRWAS